MTTERASSSGLDEFLETYIGWGRRARLSGARTADGPEPNLQTARPRSPLIGPPWIARTPPRWHSKSCARVRASSTAIGRGDTNA